MKCENIINMLNFYFITDFEVKDFSVIDQVKIAIRAGATTIQYRNKNFCLNDYNELIKIRDICYNNKKILIINDDVLLAKSVGAHGVHIGQNDCDVNLVRDILGTKAFIGLSVSSLDELKKSSYFDCDYLGVGPIFNTSTKIDANIPIGVNELKKISNLVSIPIVAIGGINATNLKECIYNGACGVAVISYITRSRDPLKASFDIANICLN